jgi:uncharacterized protein (DUF488 family)
MSSETRIYTIGFTKKGAKEFFGLLERAGVERLIDVRRRNRSQLSGFAKRDDLRFFLDELLDVDYEHRVDLAPSSELLDDWRDDRIDWETFEERFLDALSRREVDEALERSSFDTPTALLCSEHEPDRCHRRLVVEYLDDRWDSVSAIHLVE